MLGKKRDESKERGELSEGRKEMIMGNQKYAKDETSEVICQ